MVMVIYPVTVSKSYQPGGGFYSFALPCLNRFVYDGNGFIPGINVQIRSVWW